jgi:hypothetical protein
MGRVQAQSVRVRIQDKMKLLRDRYRAVLKENEFQDAFDELARLVQRDGRDDLRRSSIGA